MASAEIVKFLDKEMYTIVFLATLMLVLLWEFRRPRRLEKWPLVDRWRTNFSLFFINLFAVYLIFPAGAVVAALYAQSLGYGVFHWLEWPYWAAFLVGILVMDFVNYLQHVLMHRIPLLWRIHRAHHADPACDVTTSLRFHPAEALLGAAVDLAVIFACGVPPLAVASYRVARIAVSTVVHGNIGLGTAAENLLRVVLVTPDLHRVHHSRLERESNSNYSGGIIWWDKLCGTYCAQPEGGHQGMGIGVEGYPSQRAMSVRHTLRDGFSAGV